ncbi:MAG: hypothetical protein R2685_13820 [Candidatus Nitrosocosmicus sp.]|nr:hypothetical protein [Candidatus Nitrosocosmicus sp.]
MSLAIYVSKEKPQTIIELKRELSNDGNYINEGMAKSTVRIRFLPFVYCIDCGDVQCSVGGIDSGCNTPIVKCDNCEFIYHDNKNFMDLSKGGLK